MRVTWRIVGLTLALQGAFAAGSANAGAWATRPDPEVFYRISAESFGLGASNSDTILVSRVPGKDGQSFWAAERWQVRKDIGKPLLKRHVWLDGRECPAMEAALRGLADLPPARIGSPTSTDHVSLVFDGGEVAVSGPGPGPSAESSRFRLGTEGRRGLVVRLAEHAGPITEWWFKAEPTLDQCWKATATLSDGTILKTRMTSDDEAKSQKP